MKKLEQGSFLVMLVLVTVLFFFLLKPFFGAVFWACVIGLLFFPVQQRFLKLWKNRSTLAALSTLMVVITIGVIPTLFVLASFFQEGAALYQRLQSGDIDIGQRIEQIRQAFPALQLLMDRFNLDLNSFTSQLSGAAIAASRFIAQNAVQFGQDAVQWVVSLGLMLYLAFFMLRDGSGLVVQLARALPLGDEREICCFQNLPKSPGPRSKATWWWPWFRAAWGVLSSGFWGSRRRCCGGGHDPAVPDPHGGGRPDLGTGGHLSVCCGQLGTGPGSHRVRCRGHRPGGQFSAARPGGQRHQTARLSGAAVHFGGLCFVRHQRICDRPFAGRAVHSVLGDLHPGFQHAG
jgi:hypothetical protein